MRIIATVLVFASLLYAAPREVSRKCVKDSCAVLTIDHGLVRFSESGGFIPAYTVGSYNQEAQRWIPANEAPIKQQLSHRGWRVIVSAALDDYDVYGPTMRIRIIDPIGKLQVTNDGEYRLDHISVGDLFRTSAEELAVVTTGPHAYSVETTIWFLPESGEPKLLTEIAGVIDRFQPATAAQAPGVWVERETYDGLNANTKGRHPEFWRWDEKERILRNP